MRVGLGVQPGGSHVGCQGSGHRLWAWGSGHRLRGRNNWGLSTHSGYQVLGGRCLVLVY